MKPEFKVEVIKLTNNYLARPKGALGNGGWHPFTWTAHTAKTEAAAKISFVAAHREEIRKYEENR